MTRFTLALIVALGVGTCTVLQSGCSTTSHVEAQQDTLAQWVAAREALTLAQDKLIALHAAGLLPNKVLVQADPWVKIARQAIAAAERPGADVSANLAQAKEAIANIAALSAAIKPAATTTTEVSQ